MDEQLVQVSFNDKGNQLNATERSDKNNSIQTLPFSQSTLVIHYNKDSSSPPPQVSTSQVFEPIKIQVPMHFPYKKNNEMPWNYTCQVLLNNSHDSIVTTSNHALASSITNISRVS